MGRQQDGVRSVRQNRYRGLGWRAVVGRLVAVLLVSLVGVAAAAALPAVIDLRFGGDGNRTRIVLDFDRKVNFSTRIEEGPDRLILGLGEVEWRLGVDAGRPPRGLARGYQVEVTDGRSNLAVALAQPARIASALVLPPSRDSPYHRLVVDLVAVAEGPVATPSPVAVVRAVPVPVSRPTPQSWPPAAATTGRSKRPLPVVVLDPGHGGIDPGATSIDGRYEKDLVLEMAKELEQLIEQSGRYRVVLTRDGDEFIRLRDRIAKARRLGGQVFISLHADSLRLTELRGASIYTLSEQASDEEAAKFAALENKADVLTGADLSQHDAVVATILIDLAQRDTNNRSIAFADLLADELAGVTSLVKRHRRFAGFAVLKSPDVPSVLLELGYLSNPDDARNLEQPDYRAKLGRAIVRALDRYFAVPKS